MSVLAFRKRTEALQDVEPQVRPINNRYRRNGIDGSSLPDNFNREVELTRNNEPLMAVLRERALDPATISLFDVKRKIGLDR
jgi:hypothetical protein